MITHLKINFILAAAICLVLFGFNMTQPAISYGSGAALIMLNFFLLGFSWRLIFKKKFIALAVLLIVIKYAILGFVIYYSVHSQLINLGWFVSGIASFVIASLILVIKERNNVI